MRMMVVSSATTLAESMGGGNSKDSSPLSEHGRRTANQASRRLGNWKNAHIISSPARSATETATVLTGHIDHIDSAWAAAERDRNLEKGTGRVEHDELHARIATNLQRHLRETVSDKILIVTHRPCLEEIRKLVAGAEGPRTIQHLHAVHLRRSKEEWAAYLWEELA